MRRTDTNAVIVLVAEWTLTAGEGCAESVLLCRRQVGAVGARRTWPVLTPVKVLPTRLTYTQQTVMILGLQRFTFISIIMSNNTLRNCNVNLFYQTRQMSQNEGLDN